ncbi:MAG: heme o synthase [Chlamydiia bacterium]|nr:heme o synthase [Chlamydiia bacterium]
MIDYYLLIKPGIIFGNLFTLVAGYLLGSHGVVNVWLFTATFFGLMAIIASACVFNNYIDRFADQKMERTKTRPLALGKISNTNALLFGGVLLLLSNGILIAWTNFSVALLANLGFFIYVGIYSLIKGKSVLATPIGSIAGALPPVIGYVAGSGSIDLGAWILFAMMVCWQMPHFFAITLLHLDDYAKADIAVLPLVKGIHRTKIHMILYIVAFLATAAALTFFSYTGWVFLLTALIMGGAWLVLSIKGINSQNDRKWGREMFVFSLVTIFALFAVMPFDAI